MKAWIKILLGISLSLMCIFTSLGYAELTDRLVIDGDVDSNPPNAIFIVEISNIQASNATITSEPLNIGNPSAKMMSEIVFKSQNSSVTFDVLIMNGTPVTQYFDQLEQYPSMEGVEGSFSYERINATVEPGQGTAIGSGEQKLFTVTLKYTGTTANQTRKMLHEFDFVLHSDDLTEAVSKGVTDKFADILNNRLEAEIEYTYDGTTETVAPENTYQAVIDNMETNSSSGKYIGNLMGATAKDKALLTALFEGELTFPIGDQEVPVTVMVKQKNVYGSTADDLVLYITADTLSDRMSYVPVYAVVFSQNASGEWVQVGDIFAGEARVNGYTGSYFGTGSFDTESWRSTSAYYGASTRSNIKTVMNAYTAQNPS